MKSIAALVIISMIAAGSPHKHKHKTCKPKCNIVKIESKYAMVK
jgi:hypothetical protein